MDMGGCSGPPGVNGDGSGRRQSRETRWVFFYLLWVCKLVKKAVFNEYPHINKHICLGKLKEKVVLEVIGLFWEFTKNKKNLKKNCKDKDLNKSHHSGRFLN